MSMTCATKSSTKRSEPTWTTTSFFRMMLRRLRLRFAGTEDPALSKKNRPPENPDYVVLVILMRTQNELASMNAGKAVAQGTHAGNMMVKKARKRIKKGDAELKSLLREWEAQSGKQGFGTTLTLEADERAMRKGVARAKTHGIHAGIVHDSTYPIRDGKVMHLIPLDTCGFLFGRKSVVEAATISLNLMD
ncbi:MAG: hypothetical protein EOP83_06040 [Verrucomicrobiaceae bacterium]|nr:MAG: hypothetical protein EOP83_06040 [Verrucomicrobiaceae bacterium]